MEESIETPKKYHPTLTSPEGILMLFLACVADGLGILFLALDIFFGAGEVVHIIADIIFTVIFSLWMLARGGKPKIGSKFSQFIKKRFTWMVLDYVPVLGDVWPSWIIVSIQFLKEGSQQ